MNEKHQPELPSLNPYRERERLLSAAAMFAGSLKRGEIDPKIYMGDGEIFNPSDLACGEALDAYLDDEVATLNYLVGEEAPDNFPRAA